VNLAALILTATVSTASITSSRVDLYRDLVGAVELAQHLDAELDHCTEEVRISGMEIERLRSEAPELEWPGWIWPAAAVVVVVGSFAAGFSLSVSQRP